MDTRTRMPSPDRRTLLKAILATAIVPPLLETPASAALLTPARQTTISALDAFLTDTLVARSTRCGARIGDGVPDHSDVVAFIDEALELAAAGRDRLDAHFHRSRDQDLAAGDVMVVDGWVLARTEALAGSAYILLLGDACALDAKAG
jgi:hypothetical protein